MFDENPDSRPSSVANMVVHQVIAIFISPCAFLLSALATQALRLPTTVAGLAVLLSYLAGFPCGYYFPRSAASRSAAAAAWVLPSIVYTLLFIVESVQIGVSRSLAAFFSLNPTDSESLATILFTLPACSAASYSLGAFTGKRSIRSTEKG